MCKCKLVLIYYANFCADFGSYIRNKFDTYYLPCNFRPWSEGVWTIQEPFHCSWDHISFGIHWFTGCRNPCQNISLCFSNFRTLCIHLVQVAESNYFSGYYFHKNRKDIIINAIWMFTIFAFSFIYEVAGGPYRTGKEFIYSILNWRYKPGRTIVIVIIGLMLSPLLHLIACWGVHRVRLWLVSLDMKRRNRK